MAAQILDGKAIAADVMRAAGEAVARLKAAHGETPNLAVVLVGEDPASQVYVNAKIADTEAAGMRSRNIRLPAETSEADVIALVERLSADSDTDGILVQLPLPAHIDSQRVLAALHPDKDVDGLTTASAGRLALGLPGLRPCTPAGCVILAKRALPKIAGLHCVVIGRSILVGKPATLLFLAENCTVSIAHSKTADLPGLCRQADILVPAIGRPEFVRGDWIKPGAIVLDVGMNRIPRMDKPGATRLVGDVAAKEAAEIAGWLTPVPGGVGPMTRACLLRNTVLAACARRNWPLPAALA